MAGLNKVQLIGNLGKDPKIYDLTESTKMARLSLATTDTFMDRSGKKKKKTEWHNVILFRGLAEVAENYLEKGMQIYIEGKIQSRKWEDKDGSIKYSTDIIGDRMIMFSNKENKHKKKPLAKGKKKLNKEKAKDNTSDIPF